MKFFADLHIHSAYSRATSQNMHIPVIAKYAETKGIKLVASGDFTHPEWLNELKETLKPEGRGIFKYKNTFFMLAVEVSNIYSKGGKLRRIHNVVYAPDFEKAEKINKFLARYGKLASDGRPILGLDSENMLEALKTISEDIHLIPAHIWTPWYAMLGSKSGFNSIEECFGSMSKYIFAIETGLSSDPPMNWRVSFLDKVVLVSNSDAHSPAKLGREANYFDTDMDYSKIFNALMQKDKNSLLFTVEFYPEEGKYHFDGHRKCDVVLSPKESKAINNICPVCGNPLTIGVAHRVDDLADRKEGYTPNDAIPFHSLIPLEEIIAESEQIGKTTKKVKSLYEKMTEKIGTEFEILLNAPIEDIKKIAGEKLAEGIENMRNGKIYKKPGYDGEFGTIKVFMEHPPDKTKEAKQLSLF